MSRRGAVANVFAVARFSFVSAPGSRIGFMAISPRRTSSRLEPTSMARVGGRGSPPPRRHRCSPPRPAGYSHHPTPPPATSPGPGGTYYRHLLRAKGKPKAQAAAARKLCCYLYWMMKEGWTYEQWLQQHVHSQRSEVRPVQRMGAVA